MKKFRISIVWKDGGLTEGRVSGTDIIDAITSLVTREKKTFLDIDYLDAE